MMVGLKLRKVVILFMAVLLLASFFVGYVWKENKYVSLTKRRGLLKAELERIHSEIVKIQLDNRQLKDYTRLENLGRDHFGLVSGDVPKTVYPARKSMDKEPDVERVTYAE